MTIYQKVNNPDTCAWCACTNLNIGAFYMVGDIESARAKGEKILADLEK